MKFYLNLFFMLSLISCGGSKDVSGPIQPVPPAPKNIPPCEALYTGPSDVCPFVRNFISDAIDNHRDVVPDFNNPKLEIQIASLSQYGAGVIGLCEDSTNLRRITFDPEYWNDTQSADNKEILSHHELGHCILYRPHDTLIGSLPDSIDTIHELSIMYPFMITGSQFDVHRPYYHAELFFQAATVNPGNPIPFNKNNIPSIQICDGVKNAVPN